MINTATSYLAMLEDDDEIKSIALSKISSLSIASFPILVLTSKLEISK